MSKPLPIIHLTRPADHERLVRGLYALGYSYYGASVAQGLRMYLRDTLAKDGVRMIYPWLTLDSGAEMTAYQELSHAGVARTVVNSVNHFLAYAKSLGPPQQTDYEADAFDSDDDLDGN